MKRRIVREVNLQSPALSSGSATSGSLIGALVQHALSSGYHTATGLTVGHVIRAIGAGSFAWAELQWGDIGSKPDYAIRWPDWTEVVDKPEIFTPSAHTLGGAKHTTDTLANLNLKVSDATLDDSSAERTPTAHILGTSGPHTSTLPWSDIADLPDYAARWPTHAEVTSKPDYATRWPAFDEVTSTVAWAQISGLVDVGKLRDASRIVNKTIDITDIGDDKVLVYKADGTKFVFETKGGGGAPDPHTLVNSYHTASNLTIGHVVRATDITTFAWAELQWGDIGDTDPLVVNNLTVNTDGEVVLYENEDYRYFLDFDETSGYHTLRWRRYDKDTEEYEDLNLFWAADENPYDTGLITFDVNDYIVHTVNTDIMTFGILNADTAGGAKFEWRLYSGGGPTAVAELNHDGLSLLGALNRQILFDTGYYIKKGVSGDLLFKDANTAEKTLTQLAAAGGSGAPTDAKYVVTELHGDLTEELLHNALSGAQLHNPKAHSTAWADITDEPTYTIRWPAFSEVTGAATWAQISGLVSLGQLRDASRIMGKTIAAPETNKYLKYNGTSMVWATSAGGMEEHGNEYHDPDFLTLTGQAADSAKLEGSTKVQVQSHTTAWADITSKPDYAVRWPAFDEVTSTVAWAQISGLVAIGQLRDASRIVNKTVNVAAIGSDKILVYTGTEFVFESKGSPSAHVLATATGPHTGTLPWSNLNKTGSSLADLATRAHSNLSDAPTSAHHTKYLNSEAIAAVEGEATISLGDITLAGTQRRIRFAADDYIEYNVANDYFDFVIGTNSRMVVSTAHTYFKGIGGIDLSGTTNHTVKFDTGYYIEIDGNDLVFKDPNTAEKTLTQLAAGGGGLWTDQGTYIYPDNWTAFRIYDTDGPLKITAQAPINSHHVEIKHAIASAYNGEGRAIVGTVDLDDGFGDEHGDPVSWTYAEAFHARLALSDMGSIHGYGVHGEIDGSAPTSGHVKDMSGIEIRLISGVVDSQITNEIIINRNATCRNRGLMIQMYKEENSEASAWFGKNPGSAGGQTNYAGHFNSVGLWMQGWGTYREYAGIVLTARFKYGIDLEDLQTSTLSHAIRLKGGDEAQGIAFDTDEHEVIWSESNFLRFAVNGTENLRLDANNAHINYGKAGALADYRAYATGGVADGFGILRFYYNGSKYVWAASCNGGSTWTQLAIEP